MRKLLELLHEAAVETAGRGNCRNCWTGSPTIPFGSGPKRIKLVGSAGRKTLTQVVARRSTTKKQYVVPKKEHLHALASYAFQMVSIRRLQAKFGRGPNFETEGGQSKLHDLLKPKSDLVKDTTTHEFQTRLSTCTFVQDELRLRILGLC